MWRWRVRVWLYGSPQIDFSDLDRQRHDEWRAVARENDDQAERRPVRLRDGLSFQTARYPAELHSEVQFRRWAARSGEHVYIDSTPELLDA